MRPYSADLRGLFCRYLDEGMSSRAAGRVVGVSASTAVKWAQRRRATGSVAASKVGDGKTVVLEAELIWRQSWPTRHQTEAAIFQYINGFYNTRRRHSYLGGISPLAFEAKVA